MIELVPIAGLCNRMRAIDAGLELAKQWGVPLQVQWRIDGDLGCAFHDLFLPIDRLEMVHCLRWHSALAMRAGWSRIALRSLGAVLGRHFYHYQQNDALTTFLKAHEKFPGRPVHVVSYSRFFSNPDRFAAFKPLPVLQERIERMAQQFTPSTVGVHIRRTDNERATQVSRTELFHLAMDNAIEADPGTRFYLATDCAVTKAAFIARYGDRILTHHEPVDRTTTAGMQQAVVELYCLSRTGRMFTSFFSSFSRTAAAIGRIDATVIK